MIFSKDSKTLRTIKTHPKSRLQFCIDDKIVTELAKLALIIEKHYKKPMEIEWAYDHKVNKLYIVQARPETVHNQE